jgi:hypothetical protein
MGNSITQEHETDTSLLFEFGRLTKMPHDGAEDFQYLECGDIDLFHQLTFRRRSYTAYTDGEKVVNNSITLTMYHYPECCHLNVQRIQKSLPQACGRNPVISACIHWGVVYLANEQVTKELIAVNERFATDPPESAPEYILSAVSHIKDNFRVSINNPLPKVNVCLPGDIYRRLSKLASDLGVKVGDLGALAMCRSLYSQPHAYNSHAETMRKMVGDFLGMARFRVDVMNLSLRHLGCSVC